MEEGKEVSRKELLQQLRAAQKLEMGGNGSGSAQCYKVQARCLPGCGPKVITGAQCGFKNILTDSEWQTLHFPTGPIGVPSSRFRAEYAQHGFLSYAAAQALRWWFLAEEGAAVSAETRLVEYEFKYSYSAEPVKAVCLVDPEQREDIMPDWGKKEPVSK